MKAPATMVYWKDWCTDQALQRCSFAAQGVLPHILLLMHSQDEYGVLRWPLAEIARTAKVPLRYVRELATKSVLKGSDSFETDFHHIPTHAGKRQEPVLLVKANGGSCWFSARLVRDAWARKQRGGATRFTATNQPTGTPTARVGDRSGDGLAFAVAFAVDSTSTEATESIRVAANSLAHALREIGYSECSAGAPEVMQMAAAGITVDELKAAAVGKVGKPLAYIATRAINRRSDANGTAATAPATPAQDPIALANAQERRDIEARLLDIKHRHDVLGLLSAEAANTESAPLYARLRTLESLQGRASA